MNKILLLVLTFTLTCSSVFAEDKDPVVATVNGATIKLSKLNKQYYQNLLYVSNKIVTRETVLTNLINREIGIQKAKQDKLQEDSVVKEKMEDVLYNAKNI